jgi:hypothetical protein
VLFSNISIGSEANTSTRASDVPAKNTSIFCHLSIGTCSLFFKAANALNYIFCSSERKIVEDSKTTNVGHLLTKFAFASA